MRRVTTSIFTNTNKNKNIPISVTGGGQELGDRVKNGGLSQIFTISLAERSLILFLKIS